MNYSMVVSDWDDTLTPIGDTIPQRTKAALDRIRAEGVTMAIVSGRSPHGIHVQLRRNEIDDAGLYMIAYNGGLAAQTWDDEPLFSHQLDRDLAVRAARVCAEADAAVMVHSGRQLLTDRLDNYGVQFEAESNDFEAVLVPDFENLDFTPVKLLVGGEKQQLTELCERLRTQFAGQAEVMLSADFLLEFTAKGVDKGNALRGLCKAIDIPIEQVVAFGDNHNDIPMLRAAGHSVAVANAVPQAREIADEIVGPCTACGVADGLDELFPTAFRRG